MLLILVISIILGSLCLIASYFLILYWISVCEKYGILGRDMGKLTHPKIPESGGLPVISSFIIFSILGLIILYFFNIPLNLSLSQVASIYIAIIGILIIGIIDDIHDMRKIVKAIMPMVFALPFAFLFPLSISLGFFTIVFSIGLRMIIIPLMVTSAANVSNMLEGYNGMGIGIVILMNIPIIVISLIVSNVICILLSIIFLGACIAFYFFNRYPAKLFPGDTLTLTQGALLAMIAMIGGFPEYGAILFLPMIFNAVLTFSRIRTDFAKFGYRNKFGEMKYSRSVIALPHYFLKKYRLKEWQLSLTIHSIQFCVSFGVLTLILILN